ncbi:MAG: (4Fe-4S)-binding protein [Patulibacter sp.]
MTSSSAGDPPDAAAGTDAAGTDATASSATDSAAARPPDPPAIRRYARADGAAVTFEAALCEHAGECVRGLPDVFDTAKRPWIQPEHASLDALETVIGRCPSLALKFERSAAN